MFDLKGIHLRLGRYLGVGLRVVIALDVHIIDQSHSQQVQVADGNAQLHTAQQKQRGCQLPLGSGPFFLAVDWVCTFSPHSSMISGSTW